MLTTIGGMSLFWRKARHYAYSSRTTSVIELATLLANQRHQPASGPLSGSSLASHTGSSLGNFVDALPSLTLVGGSGGSGGQSYDHSSRSVRAPPSGGAGGRGGSVFLTVNPNVSDLSHIRSKRVVGGQGASGHAEGAAGSAGKDEHIEVPLGTLVRVHAYESSLEAQQSVDADAGFMDEEQVKRPRSVPFSPKLTTLCTLDMDEPGKTVRMAIGGAGGLGNRQLYLQSMAATSQKKSRAKKTSLEASPNTDMVAHESDEWQTDDPESLSSSSKLRLGAPGSMAKVSLELRVISDVGLVGPPNAGKSSLLSVLTRAKPKIGHWPFTTLAPSLGMLVSNDRLSHSDPITIADIPGLIHGASHHVGLGLHFLRHVARCSALVLVLDGSLQSESGAYRPVDDYRMLRQEMHAYHPALSSKPFLILINKADCVAEPERTSIMNELHREIAHSKPSPNNVGKMDVKIAWVSAKSKEGIPESVDFIKELVRQIERKQ